MTTRFLETAVAVWKASGGGGEPSRRRDCPFAGVLSSSLLKRLLKGESVSKMTVSPTARRASGRRDGRRPLEVSEVIRVDVEDVHIVQVAGAVEPTDDDYLAADPRGGVALHERSQSGQPVRPASQAVHAAQLRIVCNARGGARPCAAALCAALCSGRTPTLGHGAVLRNAPAAGWAACRSPLG